MSWHFLGQRLVFLVEKMVQALWVALLIFALLSKMMTAPATPMEQQDLDLTPDPCQLASVR